MKKYWIFAMVLGLLLSACSSGEGSTANASVSAATPLVSSGAASNGQGGQRREDVPQNREGGTEDGQQRPTGGRQVPEGGQQVYGKVESIEGNSVTLALGTVPEGMMTPRAGEGGEQRPSRDMSMQDGANIDAAASGGENDVAATDSVSPEPENRQLPETMQPPEGMEMPEGMQLPEGMQRPGGGGGRSGGGTVGVSIELELTGETATYLLPVGMSLGGGDFTTVSEGMTLMLTLGSEGNVVAGRILGGA